MLYNENVEHLKRLNQRGFLPDTVLDIGVSNGEFFNGCSRVWPDAKYFLFEARELEQTTLIDTIQQRNSEEPEMKQRVVIFPNQLLTAVNGDFDFYRIDAGSSIYEENSHFPRTKEIKKGMRLDSALGADDLQGNVFVKIDVQGAELDVLIGAGELIEQFDVVQLEVSLMEYNEGAPDVTEVHAFMDNNGFALYDFGSIFLCETDSSIFQMDWVFIKKDSRLRKDKLFWKLSSSLSPLPEKPATVD